MKSKQLDFRILSWGYFMSFFLRTGIKHLRTVTDQMGLVIPGVNIVVEGPPWNTDRF